MNKILYVGPVPPEQGGSAAGGIATHAWALARYVANHGSMRVIVYHGGRGGVRLVDNVLLCGRYTGIMRLARNRFSGVIRSPGARKTSSLEARLRTLVEEYHPDLIHVHSLHNPSTSLLKRLYPNIPVIVSDHGFWNLRANSQARENYRSADAVIAVSQYCAYREDSEIGVRQNRCVVHNPVDETLFLHLDRATARRKLGWEKDETILLFVASENSLKQKGFFRLMTASSFLIQRKNTTIALLGPSQLPKMTSQGNTSKVLALGKRMQVEIPLFINASNLLVMPSQSESFGLAYAEALMCGVCCVGFDKTLDEFRQRIGRYVGEPVSADQADKPDRLAHIIETALRRSSDANGPHLARAAKNVFSWDRGGSAFLNVYNGVLRSPESSRGRCKRFS